MKKIFVLFVLVFLVFSGVTAQQFPKNTGLVNDFANIIPNDIQQQLESKLRDFEKKTSMEIAVVTINSLGDMSIEEYAEKLFKEWGIGKKGKDNGVLFIVSMQERKMRIETGYGAEALLPDAICKRITSGLVVPYFKKKEYAAGIVSGTNGIIENLERALKKEESVPAPVAKKDASAGSGLLFAVLTVAIIFIFAALFWLIRKKSRERKDRFFEAVKENIKTNPKPQNDLSETTKFAAAALAASALGKKHPEKENTEDEEHRRREKREEEEEASRRRRRDDDDDDPGSRGGLSGGSSDDGGSSGGFDFGGGGSGGGGASDGW